MFLCHGTRHVYVAVLSFSLVAAVSCSSNPPPHPRCRGRTRSNTGPVQGLEDPWCHSFCEVRDDSSMLVTGAPIGFGDAPPALSKAYVVMQCNAVVY